MARSCWRKVPISRASSAVARSRWAAFWKEEERRQRLARHVLGAEDTYHLERQLLHLGRSAALGVQLRQLERDQSGVVGHVASQEVLAQLAQDLYRLFRAAQAGGDLAFGPAQTDEVEGVAELAAEGRDSREPAFGFMVALERSSGPTAGC